MTIKLSAPFRPSTACVATNRRTLGGRLSTRAIPRREPRPRAGASLTKIRRAHDGTTFKDAGDALNAGWSRADFDRAFSEATPLRGDSRGLATIESADAESSRQYEIVNGEFCVMRTDRDGNRIAQRLCNFTAQVLEEIVLDDGAEQTTVLRIAGRLASGKPLASISVPLAEFREMGAWLDKWGYAPLVYVGISKREHLRVAIYEHSNPKRRHVFAYTGWRQIGQTWVYLHGGGAVGGGEEIAVNLPTPLDRFTLPETAVDPTDAVRWSLKLLECAPMDVAAALLGAVYLAPLASILPPDFTVWLLGPSGSYKSELSALAQRHFGATLDRTNLPATWGSTEGALENQAFVLKDALLVIDDYPPQADAHAQRDQARRVERVLRHVGNRSGRGRLRADLSQRAPRPPRGLLMSSGEDVPPTRSIVARLVVVEVEKERIDEKVLTALQDNGERLSHSMRAFIEYLQPRLSDLHETLPARHRELRAVFQEAGRHSRQAGSLAMLAIGFEVFSEFAFHVGAIGQAAAGRLCVQARSNLAALGARQGQHLKDTDVAERFVEVLRQEVAQGRAVLLEVNQQESSLRPGVEMMGVRDRDYGYVLPDIASRIVSRCLREAGEAWDVSPLMLHKALVKKGFVIAGPDGRIEVQRRIGRSRPRVLKMPIGILYDEDPPGSNSGSTFGQGPEEIGAASCSDKPPLPNEEIRWPAPVAPVAPVRGEEDGFPHGI